MADIRDAQVNAFLSRLRVDMEDLNQLQAYLRDTKARYDSVVSTLPAWAAAASRDGINDGRSSEGITKMTKADMIGAMDQITTFLAQMDGAGVLVAIRKATVRPLRDRRGV